ncbi:hypothetical protein ABPG74_010297 [Tetrahymena malaccensis]
MDQQIASTAVINSNGFRSEKKIRLGTGLGFRNQSQIQRTFNKSIPFQNEQIPNGTSNSANTQTQNQQQFNITCSNYYVGNQSPTSSMQLQQQNLESPQTNQLSSSQTQNGFFRRKINLKMSSTNLKAFLSKQPSENPIMIKSSKNRFVNSHLSQGSIQTHNTNGISLNPAQQIGNFFGSQISLPCPSISNSSNAHSPQTQVNALNNTNTVNATSTFQTAINSVQNNSNSDSRRSSNLQGADSIINKYPISNFKKGDIVGVFNRGKRVSQRQSKNTSFTRHEQNNNIQDQPQEKKLGSEDKSDSNENQDLEDKNDDANHLKNNSITKNTIANYSHNTESTNATAQISHHNYPLHMSHHYFDSDKIKKKQSLTSSQTFIPSSQTQLNTPNLYVKKKFTEAKQYSNQVRQQMFEQQDLEEEENFLELCETLQKINYD